MVVAATEVASTDPILKLFIDDLHQRLSAAHEDAARLHQFRAVDAATMARLTTELADKESRLARVEEELRNKTTQNAALRRQVHQISRELETTRSQLASCVEGYNN